MSGKHLTSCAYCNSDTECIEPMKILRTKNQRWSFISHCKVCRKRKQMFLKRAVLDWLPEKLTKKLRKLERDEAFPSTSDEETDSDNEENKESLMPYLDRIFKAIAKVDKMEKDKASINPKSTKEVSDLTVEVALSFLRDRGFSFTLHREKEDNAR